MLEMYEDNRKKQAKRTCNTCEQLPCKVLDLAVGKRNEAVAF